jgi:rod shape determining protein RodA
MKTIINKLKSYKLANLNFRLLVYVIGITLLGIFTIGSATDGSGNFQLKQAIGLGLGIIVLIITTLVSYKFIFKFYWLIYLGANALLVLVLLIGTTNKGATRWIDLGFTEFQPSEICKIFFIIFVSTYLYKRREKISSFKTLFGISLFAMIQIFLIYKEPDLSTTIVFFVAFCAIMFLSGVHYKIVTAVIVIAVPVVIIVGYLAIQPDSGLLEEYQYNRIVGFYQKNNPEAEKIRYQQENSLLAIGSGGLSGKGLDNNTVTSVKNGNFLSESHTDFIFTIVGEELGFIGCSAVIVLIFLIVLECFITGSRTTELHGKLYCFGFGIIIAIQSFINISVATMMLPNTGLTLPFVSYGLTSLISLYIGVGIVLNIGLQRKRMI